MRSGFVGAAARWVLATETESAEPEPHTYTVGQRKLRFALALAIVVASISSAVAGAGAELYYEHSSQAEGLFRQALVTLGQNEQTYEAAIASDLRQFGAYEQDFVLSHRLRQEARTTSGPLAGRLASAAVAEQQLAGLSEAQNFLLALPSGGSTDAAPAIDPAGAYANYVRYVPDLEQVDPGELHRETKSDRRKAVDMTGVAAIFVFSLVLLTLARIRAERARATAGVLAWSMGSMLAVLGAAAWILGVSLAVGVAVS